MILVTARRSSSSFLSRSHCDSGTHRQPFPGPKGLIDRCELGVAVETAENLSLDRVGFVAVYALMNYVSHVST